jgi:hypothetical protein
VKGANDDERSVSLTMIGHEAEGIGAGAYVSITPVPSIPK